MFTKCFAINCFARVFWKALEVRKDVILGNKDRLKLLANDFVLHYEARISEGAIIYSTHQEIAYELHTSRVVISRLLKKLENLNKITLHRNHIVIKNI